MSKLIAVIWIAGAFYGYYEHPTYFDTIEECKAFAVSEYDKIEDNSFIITEADNGNLEVRDSSGRYYAEIGCNKR